MDVLNQIQAIREKAEADIRKLTGSAVSELAKKIASTKEQLKSLEEQYRELTGKDLKGHPVAAKAAPAKRRRLTAAQKKEISDKLLAYLADNPKSRIQALCAVCGESSNTVRNLLNDLPVIREGERATSRYSLANSGSAAVGGTISIV